MDTKKKTFHHSKKTEDDSSFAKASEDKDEKKARVHPEVEEVEEDASATQKSEKSEQSDESEESEAKIEENTPIRVEEGDDSEKETGTPGPKINFDYPQNQSRAFSQVQKAPSGSTLDDLADGEEEEYDQTNQPVAQEGHAPRQSNPYAQQPPEGDLGIKSIRQPQSGPNFPAPQNMNGNGNRPPNQFSNPTPGGFNFRREGNNYRSNSNSKIYFVLLLVIGLVVLGGAVYVLKNQLKPAAPKPSPSPEVTITTPEPSATPEALDRSQFTIRVLNGSGKDGLAKEVADKLKALGYKIEKTANATNSAFQSTLVRTQTGDASLSAQLIKDMSDQSYQTSSGSALKKGDASNAEVILGAK